MSSVSGKGQVTNVVRGRVTAVIGDLTRARAWHRREARRSLRALQPDQHESRARRRLNRCALNMRNEDVDAPKRLAKSQYTLNVRKRRHLGGHDAKLRGARGVHLLLFQAGRNHADYPPRTLRVVPPYDQSVRPARRQVVAAEQQRQVEKMAVRRSAAQLRSMRHQDAADNKHHDSSDILRAAAGLEPQ